MKYEEILHELQQRNFRAIYFLHGEEPYFIDQLTHYVEKNILSPTEESFNLTVVYGKDTDAATIANTARRFPVMSPLQVVVVKEAQQLKDIEKLLPYVDQPAPTTLLLLAHKYKKLNGNTKMAKLLDKKGYVFTFDKMYDNQVPLWIKQYAKNAQINLAADAADMLFEYLGNDLSHIANELDKLALSLPPQSAITQKHIADNIGISREYTVFELQKNLAQRNEARAHQIADQLGKQPKTSPLVLILGSLYRFYSKLYVYLQVQRLPEAEILKALDVRNRYALTDFATAAKHYTLPQVRKALALLYEYDLKAKGVDSIVEDDQLLKEMTFRLLQS